MWTISLPLSIPVTKQKKFYLNLNQYRNAHYFTLNKAKAEFEHLIKPLLNGIPFLDECVLEYTLYPPTKQLCDIANICTVVDKFFSDTLVSAKKVRDDNYTVIGKVSFNFGSIDRDNPRVDVVIKPINKEQDEMKIVLEEKDIQQAVTTYVSENLGVEATVEFTGSESLLESIVISINGTIEDKPEPVERKTTGRRGRPRKVKQKEQQLDLLEQEQLSEGVEEVATDTVEITESVEEEVVQEEQQSQEEVVEEEEANEEQEAPVASVQSIFGNLQRPRNS